MQEAPHPTASALPAFNGRRELGERGLFGLPGVLVSPDRLVHLIAVDGHFLGSLDAQADLVAADFHNHDGDLVVDDDALVFLAG